MLAVPPVEANPSANVAPTVLPQMCQRLRLIFFVSCASVGNYRAHIIETLKDSGKDTDEVHIINSLFDCLKDGDIRLRDYCSRGCGGVGSKDADYCL